MSSHPEYQKRSSEQNEGFLRVDDYVQINKEYLEQQGKTVSNSYIHRVSVTSARIENIEKRVPLSIQNKAQEVCSYVDQITPELMKRALAQWFLENGQAGGKLQRIVEDELRKEFGIVDLQDIQQRNHMITYVSRELFVIIEEDTSRWL